MFSTKSDKDALTTAFMMALTSPTEDTTKLIMEIAEELMLEMADEDIQECRDRALAFVNREEEKKQLTIH